MANSYAELRRQALAKAKEKARTEGRPIIVMGSGILARGAALTVNPDGSTVPEVCDHANHPDACTAPECMRAAAAKRGPLPCASYYMIDSEQLAKLRAIAARLYTETRLTGDEMRDIGHALSSIATVCEQLPSD
jgi:hypothetical protein